MNSPAEILQIQIGNGVKKVSLPIYKMIILGMAAGAYIGFGAHVFLLATSAAETAFEATAAKLIGAGLFPVGLMLVVLCGAELFTGNNLLTLALMDKKITFAQLMKSWVVVYLANFAGSVLMAFLLARSGLYSGAASERAVAVAAAKVSAPFSQMVVRGILCNILVVLAVWFQSGAKDVIGKIWSIWFPIALFVFAGFEHSIANMTYIPLGIFLGADVTFSQFLISNLLPVTLGNMIGGAVIVPLLYYFAYRESK